VPFQVITKLVEQCLTKAAASNHKSLAFPALGTGKLKYDKSTVASAMFDAVVQYSVNNPSSSITEVLFVIYPSDTEVLRVFQQLCKQNGQVGRYRTVENNKTNKYCFLLNRINKTRTPYQP